MIKLAEIARVLNCPIPGDSEGLEISCIASLDTRDAKSITFLSNDVFIDAARASVAAAILVKPGVWIAGKINLTVDDPYVGYAKVAQLFEDTAPLYEGPVHPTACIDPSAHIDSSVYIGPLSVIGRKVTIKPRTIIGAHCVIESGTCIGEGCRIDSGVVIRRDTSIGDRVIIQSGAVIGSEGFGNAVDKGHFVRIPCFGNVVIEDDVEIGAGVTIDRGNFKPTIIHRGARIDNLVMIAHNVEIGEHTAMAAQVGVSGSTTIGNGVLLGGQAGLAGHLHIGDRAFIGAKAGISKDVPPDGKVTGYPARDFMKMRRIEAAQSDLPEMRKRFKALEKTVVDLQKKIDKQ